MEGNVNSQFADVGIDLGLKAHMNKVYALIGGGLLVSAATAWLIAATSFGNVFLTPEGKLTLLGTIGLWSPLILLLVCTFTSTGRSPMSARLVYWTFVALQGIGLSLVARGVPGHAIAQAFAITAATFGAMSLYGYLTKRDLSGIGNFLLMGLFGIIIASIVNIFLHSPGLDFAVSVIGVLIFAGFTAYDTQNIKSAYLSGMRDGELEAVRYWAALDLYLDIVNLFLFFLDLERD